MSPLCIMLFLSESPYVQPVIRASFPKIAEPKVGCDVISDELINKDSDTIQ